MTKGKKKNTLKQLLAILGAVVLFILSILGVLQAGVFYAEKNWEYWKPSYKQTDILPLLQKNERTQEDYDILYQQTGLTKIGVDGLLEKGDIQRVLAIQTHYFGAYEIKLNHFAPYTYQEEVEGNASFAEVQDGDIVVSASVRVSWFRYGHAALVVDGKNKRILEAISIGSKSETNPLSAFQNFSSFIILRPKIDREIKAQVASFAKQNMVGVPYRLTRGVFSKKYNPEEFTSTQCAHLVWYAYKKFGYDLDSTGGGVVKPQDVALSPLMEVVQVYGFNPVNLWS